MEEKSDKKLSSTYTLDNFSSTTQLTNNEYKVSLGSKDVISEKEYNPYEHRHLDHPNSIYGALIHILKSSLGTGILAIPLAFRYSGLVVGLVGTLLIGLLCTYTVHLLVVASLKMCRINRVPSLGFAETAYEVFRNGPKGARPLSDVARLFVDFALILAYYSGNAVYTVFIATTLKEVIEYFHTSSSIGKEYYMLAVCVPLLFLVQIRHLKYLVPFSAVANVTMLVAFGITLYYTFKGIGDVDIKDRDLATGVSGIPHFLSTVIFAMEGVGSIMPVENSMLKPRFIGCPGVLNTAMIVVSLLYAVIGFFGYWTFGSDTQPAITSNLPLTLVSQVAKICIGIAVFFTYMLQFYVPTDITWRKVSPWIAERWQNIAQIAIRAALVLIITGVAAAVPDLGTIIDLVGAICFSTLGLFIPAIIDLVLNWDNKGVLWWRFIKNVLIALFSLFALVSGSIYAFK